MTKATARAVSRGAHEGEAKRPTPNRPVVRDETPATFASAPIGTPAPPPAQATREKERLRLWIRLLRASRTVEAVLRERFKSSFATTLPRFDVMAALDRAPGGMLMSDLSRFLLVSNGNVTGIVDRLVADRLVTRTTRKGDRRTSMVTLTSEGRTAFAAMATAHAGWIDDLLGDIGEADVRRLSTMLTSFRSDWEERA